MFSSALLMFLEVFLSSPSFHPCLQCYYFVLSYCALFFQSKFLKFKFDATPRFENGLNNHG